MGARDDLARVGAGVTGRVPEIGWPLWDALIAVGAAHWQTGQ